MCELPALKAKLRHAEGRVGLRMANGKIIAEEKVIERLTERLGLLEDVERLSVTWVDESFIPAEDFYFGFSFEGLSNV